MIFGHFFRDCLFGWHASDPLKVWHKGKLHFECVRCGADLGVILKGQKFRKRQEIKKNVIALRSRRALKSGT